MPNLPCEGHQCDVKQNSPNFSCNLTLPKVLFSFPYHCNFMQMQNSKTALITGANKGLGLEVARQLAAKGFHVFLTARHRKSTISTCW